MYVHVYIYIYILQLFSLLRFLHILALLRERSLTLAPVLVSWFNPAKRTRCLESKHTKKGQNPLFPRWRRTVL